MKHIIRDSIIWCIDIFGISFLYRKILHTKGPLVRIIAFHDVADGVWFEQMLHLFTEKYNILTPEAFHTQTFDQEKINLLLTFDDGYQSWVDTCLPILTKSNIQGIFFINSGLLNCNGDSTQSAKYMKDHLFISSKAPLTWDGAGILHAAGHTIGGHSVNHYNLATLDQHSLVSEISEDKKTIESKLGITLTDFAYPFGTQKHYSQNVCEVAKKNGYTYQYTAKTGFVVQKKNKPIPRTLIEKNQQISKVIRWIEGGYDIMSALK